MSNNSQQQGTSNSMNNPAIVEVAEQFNQIVRVNIDARRARNMKVMMTKMAQNLFNGIRGRKKPKLKAPFDEILTQLNNDPQGVSAFAELMLREAQIGFTKADKTQHIEYDEKLLCFIAFARTFIISYAYKMNKATPYFLNLVCYQFPEYFLDHLVDIILHTTFPERLVPFQLTFNQPMKWPEKLGNPAMLACSNDVKFINGKSIYHYDLTNHAMQTIFAVMVGNFSNDDTPWVEIFKYTRIFHLYVPENRATLERIAKEESTESD